MDEGSSSPLTPCSAIGPFLGPMLIGIMIEQFLLGIICYQAVAYFRYHFSSDTSFCRSIVACLVVSTILLGILDFTTLYYRLIWEYGDCEKFDIMDWMLWMEPSLTAWVAFVTHIFYIFRCWTVTRSPAICIFLGVVALNSLASGINVAITCFSVGRLSQLPRVVVPSIIWFALTSACDACIAVVLVIYLWRRGSVLRSTDAMISRLRRMSLETGSLTAICALLNLIIFGFTPQTGYGMAAQYSISHSYTLSVLYTLLGRQDLRNILHDGSGTLITDLRSSFLAAGVLSTTSVDNRFNGEGPRLRSKTSNVVTGDNDRLKLEQLQENNV